MYFQYKRQGLWVAVQTDQASSVSIAKHQARRSVVSRYLRDKMTEVTVADVVSNVIKRLPPCKPNPSEHTCIHHSSLITTTPILLPKRLQPSPNPYSSSKTTPVHIRPTELLRLLHMLFRNSNSRHRNRMSQISTSTKNIPRIYRQQLSTLPPQLTLQPASQPKPSSTRVILMPNLPPISLVRRGREEQIHKLLEHIRIDPSRVAERICLR